MYKNYGCSFPTSDCILDFHSSLPMLLLDGYESRGAAVLYLFCLFTTEAAHLRQIDALIPLRRSGSI